MPVLCLLRTHHVIEIELESSLSDRLLNAFTIGRVAGRARTSFTLIDKAADLIRRSARVLLTGAEAVHSATLQMMMFTVASPCA